MEAHASHLLRLYLQAHPNAWVRHHLESYDDFLTRRLPVLIHSTPIEHQHAGRHIRIHLLGKDGDRLRYLSPMNEAGQPLFPNEARMKDLTYGVTLVTDVDIEYTLPAIPGSGNKARTVTRRVENFELTTLPMPVKSRFCNLGMLPSVAAAGVGECAYELGGYFIVDGEEKVLISQEVLAPNVMHVALVDDATSPYEAFAEVRSGSEDGTVPPRSHKLNLARQKDVKVKKEEEAEEEEVVRAKKEPIRGMVMTMPGLDDPVPLAILFRALGIETDEEIIHYILLDADAVERAVLEPYLIDTLLQNRVAARPDADESPVRVWTTHEALAYLQKMTHLQSHYAVLDHIRRLFLPHLGGNTILKAYYVGLMARKVLAVALKREPPSDRDHFRFKRFLVTGDLCFSLFSNTYRDLINSFITAMDKKINFNVAAFEGDKIVELLNTTTLSEFLFTRYNALGGAFIKSFKSTWEKKVGVAQRIERMSYAWALALLRRSNNDIGENSKVEGPRRLHGSSWGLTCPIDSPDGGELGLKKHLSLLALPSTGTSRADMMKFISEVSGFIALDTLKPNSVRRTDLRVYLNGAWIGMHTKPVVLATSLRDARQSGRLPKLTSIAWRVTENALHVFTDAGRLSRPLYRLDARLLSERELLKVTSWASLEKDYIDYIDAEEAETVLVSITPAVFPHVDNYDDIQFKHRDRVMRFTHSEIHPSFTLSVATNLVPFCQNNASTRNILTVQQVRQALGIYATNWPQRWDNLSVVLHYPQKPLLQTELFRFVADGRMPFGQNVVVAIAAYGGYNQEDSLLVNAGSVARGMFSTAYYNRYVHEETMLDEIAKIKTEIVNPLKGKWTALVTPRDGFDYSLLDEDGIIVKGSEVHDHIVLVGCVSPSMNGTWSDASLISKPDAHGVVDSVFKFRDGKGLLHVKIKIRSLLSPLVGDKFVIRSCAQKGTVGLIVPEQDMPFTASGLKPDIIMNPHAIPSRMTGAAVLEMLTGKAAVLAGAIVDASPFVPREDAVSAFGNILEQSGYNRHGDEYMYNGMTGERIQSAVFVGTAYYCRLKHMVANKINVRATGKKKLLTHQPNEGRANEGGLRIGEMERDSLLSHGISAFVRESLMERSDAYRTILDVERGRIDVTRTEAQPAMIDIPYAMKLYLQELEAQHLLTKIIVKQ
jgi:DNA-directed RNA polymerase II subunit RPB2